MSTIIGTPTVGLEQIQRAFLRRLFANLNTAIDEISALMDADDLLLATEMGQTYTATTVEHIAPENFYEGHRPSLIDAPVSSYPNCAVWALRATPAAESQNQDHVSIQSNTLYIEVMVKALDSEETVNRRLQRTVEATAAVIARDSTLGGAISGLITEPTIDLADVFKRKDRGESSTGRGARASYGPEWFWQGARLSYAVRKETGFASPGSGAFFRAAGADWDQA